MVFLSQHPESPVNTRRSRSLVWLVGVLGITFYGLWSIWPIQPRLTLSRGEAVEVIGLTPDGRSLVALTIVNEDDYENRLNGPLHVWDLKTGDRRMIDLPGQDNTGKRENSPDAIKPEPGTDPGVRRLNVPGEPLHDRSCHLIRTNPRGERWVTEIDLDHGKVTQIKLPNLEFPFEKTSFWISPKCRWVVDERYFENNQNSQQFELTIIDARSGVVTKDFHIASSTEAWFSDDESLAGISYYDDENAKTMIWQLEPLKELQSFPGDSLGFAFSSASTWIACSQEDKVRVIDIVTGRLVHEFSTERGPFRPFPELRFSQDGTQLFGYDYFRGMGSGDPGCHGEISEVHVWNLATGQHSSYHHPDKSLYVDPNRCEDGLLNDTVKPLAIHDSHRLFDIRTGQTLLTIPEKATIELADLDHHIAILHRWRKSRLNRIFEFMEKWKVPVPGVLWTNEDSSEVLVCDIPSGRIRETLSGVEYGYYDRNPKAFLLTPDGKTLVTTTLSSPPLSVIHVWDLVSPKSVLVPFAWSLTVPLSFLAWRAMRIFRLPLRWPQRTDLAA